jgi:hypothetical protein
MSAFEGAEFGVGDFVLLPDINLDEFMKNLKIRYFFRFALFLIVNN